MNNCRKFKKTKDPKCLDQSGCEWVVGTGCVHHEMSSIIKPIKRSPKKLIKNNCKKFKKTKDPKCREQSKCEWVVGTGCVDLGQGGSPVMIPMMKPMKPMKHSPKKSTKNNNCKKFKKTKDPKCQDQSECEWVVGTGCVTKLSPKKPSPKKPSPKKLSPKKPSPSNELPVVRNCKSLPVQQCIHNTNCYVRGHKCYDIPTFNFPTINALNKLSYFFEDMDEYWKFKGTFVFEYGWIMYLEKSLGNACTWNKKQNDMSGITIVIDKINNKHLHTQIKEWVINRIFQCNLKKRFTISVIRIAFVKEKEKPTFHANAVIFDNQTRIVTLFEPHGSSARHSDVVTNELKKFVKSSVIGIWKFETPKDTCPNLGPQTIENMFTNVSHKDFTKQTHGFCSAWSLIFLHLKLVNPDLSTKELVNYLLENDAKKLYFMIRKYSNFIVKIVKSTMESQPFSFNYLL